MRALVLSLAAVAAVAGCGGSSSEQPRTLPNVSASPSPAPSPSVAVDVPAETRPATSAGAEAFAKFFYAQTNRAFNEKNPELVRALSAPGCGACDAYIASVQRLLDQNERVEGYAVDVFAAVAPAVTGPAARVDVSWRATRMKRFDSSGKVILTEGPFRRVNEQVDLVRIAEQWRVQSIKSLGK